MNNFWHQVSDINCRILRLTGSPALHHQAAAAASAKRGGASLFTPDDDDDMTPTRKRRRSRWEWVACLEVCELNNGFCCDVPYIYMGVVTTLMAYMNLKLMRSYCVFAGRPRAATVRPQSPRRRHNSRKQLQVQVLPPANRQLRALWISGLYSLYCSVFFLCDSLCLYVVFNPKFLFRKCNFCSKTN